METTKESLKADEKRFDDKSSSFTVTTVNETTQNTISKTKKTPVNFVIFRNKYTVTFQNLAISPTFCKMRVLGFTLLSKNPPLDPRSYHNCQLRRSTISKLMKIFPESLWIKALQRKIAKWITVSPKHPKVRSYLESRASMAKENKRRSQHYSYTIHPLSSFRLYWDIFIFVLMFFHQFIMSYVIGFSREISTTTREALNFVDFGASITFIADIFLSLFTGRLKSATKEIILDRNGIWIDYRQYIIYDSFYACPIYVFLNFFTDFSSKVNVELVIFMLIMCLLSINRYKRIMHSFYMFVDIFKLSEKHKIYVNLFLRSVYL
jgi:hypothetical protein